MYTVFDNNYASYYDENHFNPNLELDEASNNEIVININPFSGLNEEDSIQENQKPDYGSFFIKSINASSLDKCKTNCETLKKNNYFPRKEEFNKECESNYNYNSFDEIYNILKKHNFSELYNKIIRSKKIEDVEYKLCNKKRKRKNESFVIIKTENEEAGDNNIKIKRGRKVNQDNKEYNRIEHNKNTEDNIIKKIKAQLLLYPLQFLNNILENNKIKYRLYKLDYKYINQLKKEEDMNILNMSLKELYSLDISPKYKNLPKNYNETKIKLIIENKDIEDYPTIMFTLNLSFGDWIELFCYSKNIDEILQRYEGTYNVNKDIIKKNIIGVEDLLRRILAKNDKHYFSTFTFFLYNYKRWFYIKNGSHQKCK